MPVLRAKGQGHCEVCGRFAYAIQVDPPDYFGEGCDIWGEWCKKHTPQWALEAMKQHEQELAEGE